MFTKISFFAALALAGTAHAVSFIAVNGAPDPGAMGNLIATFDAPLPSAFSLTGSYGITQGSTSAAATPAGDTSKYFYVSPSLASNNATLSSGLDLKTIGFYWGSIDKYNTVEVLGTHNGGATQTLFTLNGASLPPSNGDQFAASTNRRVTFIAGNGEAISGLRFASTGIAFELDDVVAKTLGSGSGAAVPEPASWALLVAGFGVVGVAARRRRAPAAVAA